MEFHIMGNFMRRVKLRSVSLIDSFQKVSREGKQKNKETNRGPLRRIRILNNQNSLDNMGSSIALPCLLPCGNIAFSTFFDDVFLVNHVL